jgi:hypothetical protein
MKRRKCHADLVDRVLRIVRLQEDLQVCSCSYFPRCLHSVCGFRHTSRTAGDSSQDRGSP